MGHVVIRNLALAALLCSLSSAAFAEDASFAKGMELIGKKQYKEAVASFDEAIKSDAKNSEAYLERALCNFHLANYEKVIEDCKEVTGHDAAHTVSKRQAYMMSAGAQNAIGRYEDAIASCGKALALGPKVSLCYSDRAYAHQRLNHLDEALKDCNEAIKLDPKHGSNYQMRATIYELMAKADRSKFRELIEARKPGDKPWERAAKTAEGKK